MPLSFNPEKSEAANEVQAGGVYGPALKFLVERTAEHNQVLRELAARFGAQLIDNARSEINGNFHYFVDLCHFNTAGGAIFAKQVFEALLQNVSTYSNHVKH